MRFFWFFFGVDKGGGDRKRCIYVRHQRARGQLVKQMRKRIPEKEEKKDSLEKHKTWQHTTQDEEKIIQFAFEHEEEEKKITKAFT